VAAYLIERGFHIEDIQNIKTRLRLENLFTGSAPMETLLTYDENLK